MIDPNAPAEPQSFESAFEPVDAVIPAGPPPDFTFHPPNSVGIATFIGWPIAGALLMAHNYRKLGRSGAARSSALLGLLATVVLALLGVFVLKKGLVYLIILGAVFATQGIAKSLQGQDLEAHRRAGGKEGTSWFALVFGLPFLVIVGGGVIAFSMYGPNPLGEKLNFGQAEIYYDDGATEAEARRLGELFRESLFAEGGRKTLRLTRDGDGYALQVVILNSAWSDREGLLTAFREIATWASIEAFEGRPLTIHLCDDDLDTVQTVSSGDTPPAQLVTFEVPGLRAELPDWPVEDRGDELQRGNLRLVANPGDQLTLHWSLSELTTRDEFLAALRISIPDVELVEHRSTTACGQAAEMLHLRMPSLGFESVVTFWSLSEPQRLAYLITRRNLAIEEHQAFHADLVSRIECLAVDAEERAYVFPQVVTPPGFEILPDERVLVFFGPAGLNDERYDFNGGLPTVPEQMLTPVAWTEMLRVEFGLAEIEPAARLEEAGPANVRPIYVATGRDEQGLVRTTGTWWHCEEAGLTFIAMHVGPESRPHAPVVQTLRAASCP